MNTHQNRWHLFGALTIGLLLTACGGGGSGSGGSSGGGGGGGGATAMSHNAGRDCLGCHRTGGAGAAKGIFTSAGTIFRSDGSAQASATVTLLVHGTSTVAATLTTDSLGNFYTTQAIPTLLPAAGQQFAVGADVVVRTTGGSRVMSGVITNGSCNACHGAAGPGNPGRVVAQVVGGPGVSVAASSSGGESTGSPTASSATASESLVDVHGSTTVTSSSVLTASALLGIAQIAAGADHSCIVRTDGAALCWGSNTKGQLGSTAGIRFSTAAHSIAAGNDHTCAITATGGDVLCWGANDAGQLGNGTTEPTALSMLPLSGATALRAAGTSTCAQIGTDVPATIYCWGTTYGYDATLDQVTSSRSTTPQRLAANAATSLPSAAMQLLHPDAQVIDVGTTRSCAPADATCQNTLDNLTAVRVPAGIFRRP